jgi:hypothetical protein
MRRWRPNLAGPGYHINRSNLLVLESKADMQKRGQASPDDGDALALTFAQPVVPAEVEEPDEEENSRDTPVAAVPAGGCDDATWRVHGQSLTAMVEVAWMVTGWLRMVLALGWTAFHATRASFRVPVARPLSAVM